MFLIDSLGNGSETYDNDTIIFYPTRHSYLRPGAFCSEPCL